MTGAGFEQYITIFKENRVNLLFDIANSKI